MQKPKFVSAKEVKVESVKSLSEKIGRAKTLAFADYRGLTVNQISAIREKVKDAGGEILVTKNTLMSRALSSSAFPRHDKQFTGPTLTIFAYEDEIAPIKAIADAAKITGLPAFKFGFFQHDLLDVSGLNMLASLPSKHELQAKAVGALSGPIYGIVSVLSANIRNLVSVLDQAANSKA